MISFLSPAFLAGAAAAALPILLHLLKRNPELRIKFAPVDLLRHAPVENTERRRLREMLLLALRVTAVLLLALAFARPFFTATSASVSAGITIVALDTSMSLSSPGRFDQAKTAAKDAIRRARAGDLVAVVTFADNAQVVASPSSDRELAAAAIDAAAAGFGATRYRAALNVAADIINTSRVRRSTIVVVTDLQEVGWDAGDRVSLPDSTELQIADVGQPAPNLAVTALRLSGDRLIATVRNTGTQPRDAKVQVAVNTEEGQSTRIAGEAAASLAPNQAAEVMLPAPRGRWAVVTVDDPGGIRGDNARYIVLGTNVRPSVLIITNTGDLQREAFYLQQALAAAGEASAGFDVEGVGAATLSGWDQPRFDAHVAAVLLSTKGLERRGRELIGEYVRKGGGLLIAAGPDLDGEVVAETLGGKLLTMTAPPDRDPRSRDARTFAPADLRHPIFQPFSAASFALVNVQRAAAIRASGCQVLARFSAGEPALVECGSDEGRVLAFASDLDKRWNDFPLHATFVPFVHETVRYLTSASAAASAYLIGDRAAGTASSPGVISVELDGRSRLVAVNVDPRESEPARISPDEFRTAVARLKDQGDSPVRLEVRQQEDRQHVWQYVLTAMIAVLVMESFVAKRAA